MTKDLQELIDIIKSKALTEEKKVEQIQAILCENPKLVNAANNCGWTALLVAVCRGHLSVIKVLLKHGADVNAATTNIGWTALGYIVQNGWSNPEHDNLKIIKVLLDCKDINVDIAKKSGQTPLCVAVRIGQTEAAQLIIEHMLIQNFKETEPDFLSRELSGYWKGFRDKCITEIEKMQNLNVGNSKVSFFDILVADKKKLASCVNDDNIIKVLDTYDYEGNFPIYADKIKSQYTKEMNEKIAADIVLNLSDALNEYTSRMIFNSLGYKEIRNLCKAGHRELIKKRHINAEAAPKQSVEDNETVSSCFSGIRIKKPDRCVIL